MKLNRLNQALAIASLAGVTAAVAQTPAPLAVLPSTPVVATATNSAPNAAPNAAANTTANANPAAQPQKLDKIEVRGVSDTDQRRQSTATKIVVTREELLKQGDTSIAEALKRLPGVTAGGPPGRGGAISMRGLGGGFTRILLNGEPIPRGFDLDSLSPEVVERVEVFRAATAEFSSQAVAGAINIVTRTPVSRDVREASIGGAYENGKLSPQVGVRFSGSKDQLNYTVNGQFTGNRFVRPSTALELGKTSAGAVSLDRASVRESRENQDQINLAPRFQWNLGKGEFIAFEPFMFLQRSRQTYTDTTVTKTGPAALFAQSLSGFDFNLDVFRGNLQYNRSFGDGGKLESSLGLAGNRFDGVGYTYGYGSANGLLLDRRLDISANFNGVTSRGKITVPYVEAHDASFGWDVNVGRSKELRDRRELSFSPAIVPENLDEQFFARNRQLAVFAQDEWKVSEAISFYSGLRWEGVTIETETRGNPQLNPSFRNASSVLSPSIQSVYKFGPKNVNQLRFALSRTYRAPNNFQLSPRKFVSANNGPTSPDRQGNPDLKPELAWGIDLGFERYLEGGGILGANLFVRDIDDVFRNTVGLVNGRWLSQPINNGKARTVGLELESKVNLDMFDKTWPRVNLRSNLAVYRSVVNNIPGPNNRLEQQVPVAFNFGADWVVPATPLSLGGNLSVNTGGEVRTAANQVVYSSVKRGLDMYAAWRFSPQTNVRLSVANMLHQDSIASNTITDPLGATAEQTTLTPTKPILRLLLTQRF